MAAMRRAARPFSATRLIPAAILLAAAGLLAWTAAWGVEAAAPARLVHRLAPPAPAAPLPPVRGPAGRPLVVIDPGHGGHDPGAVAAGAQEKAVTLAAARAVADMLAEGGGVRVALTRDTDRFLAHEERYGIARRLGASLFVSLHADASPGGGGHGATVYTLADRPSDAEAARTAARENRGAGARADDGLPGILADLTARESRVAAGAFADRLVEEAAGRLPLRTPPRRAGALVVLRAPDVPSVLFEMGYLTDPRDRATLASDAGRQAVADSIARATARHFARARIAAAPPGRLATARKNR